MSGDRIVSTPRCWPSCKRLEIILGQLGPVALQTPRASMEGNAGMENSPLPSRAGEGSDDAGDVKVV